MVSALVLPPRLRRFYRVGLVAHSVLIVSIAAGAYAGVLPTKISVIPYYDTVMHFLLVGMFGFFLDGAFEHRPIVRVPFVPRVGPAIALVLAAAEEYLQRLSPRRSSSWGDFAANATGIFVCAFLARHISKSMIARSAAAPASTRPAAGEGAA